MAGLSALLAGTPVQAGELLLNRSFESPATFLPGNNLYSSIPNWTVTNLSPSTILPFNVVQPSFLYLSGPSSPPSGGGSQYLDMNASSGTLRQTITVPANGMISLRGWFSVHNLLPQSLSGTTIQLRNASNTIVASASVSFTIADPIGTWKQAVAANIPITAGTYTFEAVIPDAANFDLASANFSPALTVTKTSAALRDPVSNLVNPKLIPGAVAAYSIAVSSPSDYAVTGNSLAIVDITPVNMALVVSDVGAIGSGPVAFTAGTSGLTLVFSGLASGSDGIEFSKDNGATWSYAPTAGSDGSDPLVTHVRVRPQGTMAANSSFTVGLRYVIR